MNIAGDPEVVEVGDGPGQVPLNELPKHDETRPSRYAFTLAQLEYPNFPVPMGVLRAVETATYGSMVRDQAEVAKQRTKGTDIESLWRMGDTWENKPAAEYPPSNLPGAIQFSTPGSKGLGVLRFVSRWAWTFPSPFATSSVSSTGRRPAPATQVHCRARNW